jgi:hypothetical protein
MNRRRKQQGLTVSLDNVQFKILLNAIQNLVKVLATAQIKLGGGTEPNARFLRVFGLSENEIADLLGVTQPAVHHALSKKRRKKRKTSTRSLKEIT